MPSVTADCIVVFGDGSKRQVLLIKRKHDPYADSWALPGGFVEIDEDLLEGATRELEEETGINGVALRQYKTFGKPGRDPRGRTISVVFYGFVEKEQMNYQAGDDAAEAGWFDLKALPDLAFDHQEILLEFVEFIKKR